MNNEFTEKLGRWLAQNEQSRDYTTGAIMLLQLSGDKIFYASIKNRPERAAAKISGRLQQYYDFRVRQLTADQVQHMEDKVYAIAKERNLPSTPQEAEESDAHEEEKFHAGRRQDHENLPREIQMLYEQNLPLMHRMRQLHLKLRTLSTDDAPCPDSERYPFLKELIECDKRYRRNWDDYDHYKI